MYILKDKWSVKEKCVLKMVCGIVNLLGNVYHLKVCAVAHHNAYVDPDVQCNEILCTQAYQLTSENTGM